MILRNLKAIIEGRIGSGKAIVLTGPRQTGKTTLLKEISESRAPFLWFDGDDPTVRALLTEPNTEELRQLIGTHKFVCIDEAQRIPNIGLTLKIITDQFPQVQLLVSGSSSFDLYNQTNEPLTGRKWEYRLYPVSWEELEGALGYLKAAQQLENRMIFGMYPDIINNPGEERELLSTLASSYLYRDILAYGGLRKPEVLEKLVQALAFQVGQEVSYNELSGMLQIDKNTVSAYIDILEKGYVVFKLPSFSRNLHNEIKTNKKVYFYDNGVRNAVIGNFAPLDLRPDKGALWENFLISERKKYLEYHRIFAKSYFWRTAQQQEIDYVEELDGRIRGYEFKWKAPKKVKFPGLFTETYKADTSLITAENYREFLMEG
jgi:predicted AAA+ superfamily ATPase